MRISWQRFLVFAVVMVGGSVFVLLPSGLLRQNTLQYPGNQLLHGDQLRHVQINKEILRDYGISEDTLQRRQDERRRHLAAKCSERSPPDEALIKASDLRSVYVDDKHRTLYCAVPKVASTNWKRVMLLLTGQMNATKLDQLQGTDVHGRYGRNYLVRLDSLPLDEIHFRLSTYFKFMFVRDPVERLVSAYKSKFVTRRNAYFQQRDGRRIIRQYRVNASKESLERGHDVSFSEFVQYLIDPRSSRDRPLNEHWRPYYQLCKPCQIKYDVIGKYETLEEDAVHVIAAISGMSNDDVTVRFPVVRRTNRTADSHTRLSSVSKEYVDKLCALYDSDFRLFDYTCPSVADLNVSP